MASELPYYRMFPKDFDSDHNVRLMTMCQLGLYIKCLNHAWVNGFIPSDVRLIAKIVGEPVREVKKNWAAVSKCFIEKSKDELTNPRLERERELAIERGSRAKQAIDKRWSDRGCDSGSGNDTDVFPRAQARPESESESESESFGDTELRSTGKPSTRARAESELDLDDPIEDFIRNSTHRMRGPKVKLNRRQDVEVLERLRSAEARHGAEEFRLGWITFVGWMKTAEGKAAAIREPLTYFLATPLDRWQRDSAPEDAPLPEGVSRGIPAAAEPATPAPASRDYLAEWNATVTAAPFRHGPRSRHRDWIREAEQDPEFVERWHEIPELAQTIHEVRGAEVSWLRFDWLFDAKKGVPNWSRLLNNLRFMTEPEKKTATVDPNWKPPTFTDED